MTFKNHTGTCTIEKSSRYGYTTYTYPGKRQSCTKVANLLGRSPQNLRNSCEAFGRDVRAYVRPLNQTPMTPLEELRKLSATLREAGVPHTRQEYQNGKGNRLEIKVTYFKAWHHDE
jgi:hypothetical protein